MRNSTILGAGSEAPHRPEPQGCVGLGERRGCGAPGFQVLCTLVYVAEITIKVCARGGSFRSLLFSPAMFNPHCFELRELLSSARRPSPADALPWCRRGWLVPRGETVAPHPLLVDILRGEG